VRFILTPRGYVLPATPPRGTYAGLTTRVKDHSGSAPGLTPNDPHDGGSPRLPPQFRD
jgi:hypothetical protein